jgi:hypothetical protein
MKKLSVIVSLSLMLSSLSWAEKYEYVRLTEVSRTIELKSGDIAWFVNSANLYGTKIVQYELDGTQLGTQSRVWSSGSNSPRYDSTFVGPCILGPESDGSWVTLKILRSAESGNKTLEWDGSKFAGSIIQGTDNNNDNSSPVPDPSGIKYDQLLGWCYFTDTPWIYSYTNGSWYYMHSMQNGIYVWNANLPNDGWMKLHS